MDKIVKFVKKLSKKEAEAFELLLIQLNKDFTKVPGLKKLRGKKNIYRIRLGKYRIIFVIHSKRKIEITKITKRDDNTYKNL